MGTCKKFVRKGCTWLPALVALALLVAAPAFGQKRTPKRSSNLPAQSHVRIWGTSKNLPGAPKCTFGFSINKACTQNRDVGDTTDCVITGANNDTCGNNQEIDAGFDSVLGASTTRVPASGSLAISAVSGNTTCVAAAFATCDVGPPCGGAGQPACLPGVTGPAAAGTVTFHSNTYVIQAGDPNPLEDTGDIDVKDLCNIVTTGSGCSNILQHETFSADTSTLTCSVSLDKQISCDGGATFHDVGIDSTDHCVGFDHPNIVVQYVTTDTGTDTLNNCSIKDVKSGGSTTEIFSGEPSGVTVVPGTPSTLQVNKDASSNPLTCTDAQAANEPNTATVGCQCANSPALGTITASDTASYSCVSCGVGLVKQVSCDYAYWNDPLRGNVPANATWHPEGGCVGFAGDTIAIRYVVSNSGTLAVNNCSITSDVGPAPSGTNPVDCLTGVNTSITSNGTIAAGGSFTSAVTTEDASCTANSLTCDSTHTANEPNKATVVCSCVNPPTPTTVTANDTATF